MDYYFWIIIKFLIGFFLIISYLNLSGKTQISQLTPVDFVGNFVLGGIIGGIIGGITYNDKIPIYQYILVLLIGITLVYCFNFFTNHILFFRRFTSGEPILIIKDKQFLMHNILEKKNKIDFLGVISQLRVKGIYDLNEIIFAQIEPKGDLTVCCDKNMTLSRVIMHRGQIQCQALKEIGKDETWVKSIIKKPDIAQKDIFLSQWHNKHITFIMQNGCIKKISSS